MREIPADERLDVVVHTFDPGIPDELAADEDALAKKRIYPEMRKAEARYFAVMLRNTLESSAQWGAVRVAPESVQFVDVAVTGRIIDSTGKHLALEITARDAAGRVWLDAQHYEGDADVGSYKTDAALKARDPFQNVYSDIANDLLAARAKLDVASLRELRADHRAAVRRRTSRRMRCPATCARTQPEKPALTHVARLPASNDPMAARVQRIRERDAEVLDTLDGYYTGFARADAAALRRFPPHLLGRDRQAGARAGQRAHAHLPGRGRRGGQHLRARAAAAAIRPAIWRARRAMPARSAASPRCFPA